MSCCSTAFPLLRKEGCLAGLTAMLANHFLVVLSCFMPLGRKDDWEMGLMYRRVRGRKEGAGVFGRLRAWVRTGVGVEPGRQERLGAVYDVLGLGVDCQSPVWMVDVGYPAKRESWDLYR